MTGKKKKKPAREWHYVSVGVTQKQHRLLLRMQREGQGHSVCAVIRHAIDHLYESSTPAAKRRRA
jgi:hypothetical protein